MTKLIRSDLRPEILPESEDIYRYAWEVWHNLGNGFTREVYVDALEMELCDAAAPYQREQQIPIYYKDILLPHTYTADFIVHEKIILIVASQLDITAADKREIAALLSAAKLHTGIFINYADKSPQFYRVLAKKKPYNKNSVRNPTNTPENGDLETGRATSGRIEHHQAEVRSSFSDICSLSAPRARAQSTERILRVEGGVV
jgi:GxxExxY protein